MISCIETNKIIKIADIKLREFMYIMISFECKFKTNKENIEKIFQHYGLRKIQSTLYVGDLNKDEREILVRNVNEIIRENDSVLILPICQNCYSKKEYCGREIKFKDDLFRLY